MFAEACSASSTTCPAFSAKGAVAANRSRGSIRSHCDVIGFPEGPCPSDSQRVRRSRFKRRLEITPEAGVPGQLVLLRSTCTAATRPQRQVYLDYLGPVVAAAGELFDLLLDSLQS